LFRSNPSYIDVRALRFIPANGYFKPRLGVWSQVVRLEAQELAGPTSYVGHTYRPGTKPKGVVCYKIQDVYDAVLPKQNRLIVALSGTEDGVGRNTNPQNRRAANCFHTDLLDGGQDVNRYDDRGAPWQCDENSDNFLIEE
jgi:hypothetical protein